MNKKAIEKYKKENKSLSDTCAFFEDAPNKLSELIKEESVLGGKVSAYGIDCENSVLWIQFENGHGVNMTRIFCIETGWSMYSNMQYPPSGALYISEIKFLHDSCAEYRAVKD